MSRAPAIACACGSAAAYAACCGRFIDGGMQASTAAELMRSRYTAYAHENSAYLLATWHASTRPEDWSLNLAPARWIGLDIRHAADQDSTHATVEFVARYRIEGRAHRLHEKSRFLKQDGRWYYLDGVSGV